MEKIHSKLRRTDYYDFGHGLTLMNILSKTEDGKLDRIDTSYIGVEGNEFVCVGFAKDLSAPGVIFSYGEYVRFQRANKATYLDFFKQNSRSQIIVDGRAEKIQQVNQTTNTPHLRTERKTPPKRPRCVLAQNNVLPTLLCGRDTPDRQNTWPPAGIP